MSSQVGDIILHNYPQSPVAEKVRVALGIKRLSWRSVEIPRLPPKPMLTALTGGYRRTPVMQIGADIYCDSQCIIRELERRHPIPTFFPRGEVGLTWCLSRWVDGAFFDLAVRLVLGAGKDELPSEFTEDRGRLYFGANWEEDLARANAELPHLVAQMRVPLTLLNDLLNDGRRFLLGDEVGAFDAQIYHVIWFVRGRWDGGASLLSNYPALERWEASVRSIGHGTSAAMPPEEAMTIARDQTSTTEPYVSPDEPQGISVGRLIMVAPDVDGGEQPVQGRVRYADAEMVVLERTSENVGMVCVHFPRNGYRIQVM